MISESGVETNNATYNQEVETSLAGFIHRRDTISAPEFCNVRVRLTPSGPSKTGAVWFDDPAPVNNGFDTFFTFQISDHSKQCTLTKDQYFSIMHHRTCSVHGGDGFAFVVQMSPHNTSSLGGVGGQMGFGGIENSLAIAFDTWQNPGEDTLNVDHISIQSRGTLPNDALEAGLLGVPRAQNLADGEVHLARITYFNKLKSEYFDKLVASDSLLPYLKDNGEQKRIGTLAVFVDEGIETDTPLMALPINLSLLLKLPTDKAFVGFTSSTGRFYEKHDILSWLWCDEEPCDLATRANYDARQTSKFKSSKAQPQEVRAPFDYHQETKYSTAPRQQFVPGPGYGGGDADGFPTENQSPDTDPWILPVSSFSNSRNIGLAADATKQLPPETLY